MTDVVYGSYVAIFRELRAAVDSNDLLRLREAFESIAGLAGLERAASDLAVWDAARLQSPRTCSELVSALTEARAVAA